jgi:hypothetical protein
VILHTFAAILVVTLASFTTAQEIPAPPRAAAPNSSNRVLAGAGEDTSSETVPGVVRSLYQLVSVKPGGPQTDWEKVRALFYKDAVIVLRTTRSSTQVFSVQGFIDDFIAFNHRAHVQERGFTERVVRLRPMVFQDMAHVLVLYEASIPASPRPPQQGVDSFHLMKKDGRWWIVSVLNEIPATAGSIPRELEP